MVTTLLIDADASARRTMRSVLVAADIAVVGEASNGRDGVRLTAELRPEVVVLALELPLVGGIEATRRISALSQPPAVVVLAVPGAPGALDAILAGARGSLLAADHNAVATTVTMAAAGTTALSPAVASRLVERMRELETDRRRGAPQRDLAALSGLERDILERVASGLGNAGIGSELFLSASTVKQHLARIERKLGVHNRVQAAVEAVRIGLI